jgi:hypothetical protein
MASEAAGAFEGGGECVNRRRAGRVRCTGLHCSLGEVIDLCASGMRIRSTRPVHIPGIGVTLTAGEVTLKVQARIAWSRQAGRKAYEAGVEFLSLDSEQRRTLAEIARLGSTAFGAVFYGNAA